MRYRHGSTLRIRGKKFRVAKILIVLDFLDKLMKINK